MVPRPLSVDAALVPTEREKQLREVLAFNLARLRNEVGWSQEAAAARAPMHWTTWQRYELGTSNPALDDIARLADVLDVDPLELFKRPPPARRPTRRAALGRRGR